MGNWSTKASDIDGKQEVSINMAKKETKEKKWTL